MVTKVRMVEGPAKVTIDGACSVLGADASNRTLTVRSGKALPFEPGGKCRIHARLGRGGHMWLSSPRTAGTMMWGRIANQLLDLFDGNLVVMLAGDTDTGKSTLAAYLANIFLQNGLRPYIIDADIGQGDLAPPGSIGAAAISVPVTDLRDIRGSLFEFIGNISPAGFERLIATKIKSIHEKSKTLGDVCIVNTDGYVSDDGLEYKQAIAKELNPDVIVHLGDNPKLLEAFRDSWKVLQAKASNQVLKSRYERKNRRLDQFTRHIGSGSVTAGLPGINFVFMDKLYTLADIGRPDIVQLDPENMKGMFVGLCSGRVNGFGIITSLTKQNISIQTDVSSFQSVYLGSIRLADDKALEIRIA